MSPDLIAGLAFGACVTLVVCVKAAAWLIEAFGRLLLDWIYHALNEPH